MPNESMKEQAVTPEEKLFRLIAAAGKDDQELQELLARYGKQKVPGSSELVRNLVPFVSSPIVKTSTLVILGALVFYFLSGIQVGRTFYMSPGARLGQVGTEHAVDFFPKFFSPIEAQKVPGSSRALRNLVPSELQGNEIATVTLPVKEVQPYRLVGISFDAQGPVAMIETSGSERAKFVRQGDTVEGDVKVAVIKDYTVTLAAGKKTWELT